MAFASAIPWDIAPSIIRAVLVSLGVMVLLPVTSTKKASSVQTQSAEYLQDLYQLAVNELEGGNFENAKERLRVLTTRIPEAPVPHYLILTSLLGYELRKFGRRRADMRFYRRSVNALRKSLKAKGEMKPSDHDKVMVHYGLAHYYRSTGDWDTAWKEVTHGAKYMYKAVPNLEYRISQEMLAMQAVPLTFSRQLVSNLLTMLAPSPELKAATPAPVFIIGLPRSGSTLIEQVLAKHSQVVPGGESPVEVGARAIEEAMLNMMQEAPILISRGLEDDSLADALARTLNYSHIQALRSYAETYVGAMIQKSTQLGASQHTRFITDKTLNNFLALGFTSSLLPHVKIIYCQRDGMDIGMSMFWHFFAHQSQLYSYDLHTLGKYIALAQRAIAHLRTAMPGRIHTLVYEELVRNFTGVTKGVLRFLGLNWEDTLLNFTDQNNTVKTASLGQVRRPLYNHSVGLWKKHKTRLKALRAGWKSIREGDDDDD